MTAPGGEVEPVDAGDRLRIAVLGDFAGVHTRSWVRWFIDRGHDVHAISFYPPPVPVEGAKMHALRAGNAPSSQSPVRERRAITDRLPRGIARIAHALRYRAAGLKRTLQEIDPDVFHAHFVVEHGFYGAMAGWHPFVVSAWGSDVLVEPKRDVISRRIAKWTIGRADLVTSNNAHMAERIVALGTDPAKVHVITLGADRYDLGRTIESVNVRPPDVDHLPTVISTRAHEPLYNVDKIIDAYKEVARTHPRTRLVVAHRGSLTERLQRDVNEGSGRVEFVGFLDKAAFRDALAGAEVFVSIPSSDATSVALLQAMAAGCFPIVLDLPSQRELIDHGVNGFRVPAGDVELLTSRIAQALDDAALRRRAAELNRQIVEERGLNEVQMAKMERLYLRLVRGS
jgi:glycosyltransferase involved in cell wall biosynthesis